ncbi:MAG: hypothetical protein AAGM22_05185 [Acidobacteriota bacterium]
MWVGVEMAGVALYALFAFLGRRRSELFLAAGWALHPVWDLGVHGLHGAHDLPGLPEALLGLRPGVSYAPEWYVLACLSFDVLVAMLIVRDHRRR